MFIKFSANTIKKVVLIWQIIYLLIAFLYLLIILISPFTGRSFSLYYGISFIVCSAVYYGLMNRKMWAIQTIILLSIYSIITTIRVQPGNFLYLVLKIATLAFNAFEIYFFTKKEVRNYFTS